jgi:protein Tob/BTG
MKNEIQSAANLITHIIRLARLNISEAKLMKFNKCLIEAMFQRFRDHWIPERPQKGTGYRTMRFNGTEEPLTAQAAKNSSISYSILIQAIPIMIFWIDPFEVCYRFGENGSIYVLYDRNSPGPWTHHPKLHTTKPNSTCQQALLKFNSKCRSLFLKKSPDKSV